MKADLGRQLSLQIAEALRSETRLILGEATELRLNAGNFGAQSLGNCRSLLTNKAPKLLLNSGADVLIDQPLRDIVQAESHLGRQLSPQFAKRLRYETRLILGVITELLVNADKLSAQSRGKCRIVARQLNSKAGVQQGRA